MISDLRTAARSQLDAASQLARNKESFMPPTRAIHPRVLLLLAIVQVACANRLEPAAEADRAPAVAGRAAEAEEMGVRVVASAGAWRGSPVDLDRVVTPILVSIANESGRGLAIRYEYYHLLWPGRASYAALPPFRIDAAATPLTPVQAAAGFEVAPYLSPWYPGWTAYSGAFEYPGDYYETHYPALARVAAPTFDMLQSALPEGVLAPGGSLTGFLYFPEVELADRLVFVARLVDASSGEIVATVEIPFDAGL